MVLDDLESVVDQLCDTDPAALSDGESIQRMHRCLARMEAATTRASAAFESGGEWQADEISHTALMDRVRDRIGDKRVLVLGQGVSPLRHSQ